MIKRCILFDLDNTLYPRECGLFRLIEGRIIEYLRLKLGLAPGEAVALRQKYLQEYGFTLIGLMNHYKIDPQDYLDFVHDISIDGVISEDMRLAQLMTRIPVAKAIFTNGTQQHARRILRSLGIEPFFPYIFDIAFMDYKPKPHPSSFQKVLDYMDVRAKECLMVDDHLPTLSAAKKLGMTTIYVGRGEGGGADYKIREIKDIEGILKDLQLLNIGDGR